jgi:hypothetical protein
MRRYKESGFWFDFRAANDSVIHDKEMDSDGNPQDGNTCWPGVDFRVFENDREVWVEVKSWSHKYIRGFAQQNKSRRDFLSKIRSDEFRYKIFGKFIGTTSYLIWSGKHIPERVFYVVFLEPPNRGSLPLAMAFGERIREEFKNVNNRPWGNRIRYIVVDMARFQSQFPNYSVTRV